MVWGALIGLASSAIGGALQSKENRRSQRLNERQNRLATRYGFQALDASRGLYRDARRDYTGAIDTQRQALSDARGANALAGYNAFRNVNRQVDGAQGSITAANGLRGINSGSASLNSRARLLREAGNVYGDIGARIGLQDSNIALRGGQGIAQAQLARGQNAQQQGNSEANILQRISGIPLQLEYQADQSIGQSVGTLGAGLQDLIQQGWARDAQGNP